MKGEYRLFRQGGGKGAFACVQVERIPGAKAHAEPVRHAQGVAARTPPWCIAAARDGVSGALAALRSLGLETTGESIEINEIGINLVDTTADAIHCAAFLATADAFGAVERFELGYHEQWTVTAL